MRKPQFASRKSTSYTGWWKHARPFGKRTVNKSERKGAKRELQKQLVKVDSVSIQTKSRILLRPPTLKLRMAYGRTKKLIEEQNLWR